MYISGDNFTTFELKIKPNFKPNTIPAIQWDIASDGNWYGTDRGSSSDIFDTTIRLYGQYSQLKEFLDAYEYQRSGNTISVVLSAFSDTEHIFGADIDYTGNIIANVLAIDDIKQQGLNTYEMSIDLRASGPSFTGSSSLPTLKALNTGYSGYQNYTETFIDTYNGTDYSINPNTKHGLFEGTFNFTDEEAKNFRRYMLTTARSSSFTLSNISGVLYPFGPGSSFTYPGSVKCIKWQDLGLWGLHRWLIKLQLAEVL